MRRSEGQVRRLGLRVFTVNGARHCDNTLMRILWQQFTEVAPKALVTETTKVLVGKGVTLVDVSALDVEALKQAAEKFGSGSAEQRFAARIIGRLTAERASTVGGTELLKTVQGAQEAVSVPAATALPTPLPPPPAAVEPTPAPPDVGEAVMPGSRSITWPPGTYTIRVHDIWITEVGITRRLMGGRFVAVEVCPLRSVRVTLQDGRTWGLTGSSVFSHESAFPEHTLKFTSYTGATAVHLRAFVSAPWGLYDPPPSGA